MKVDGEKVLSQPRQVSAINNKDVEIAQACASDASTVVLTSQGDVFVLHEYHCRRIVAR